MSDKPWDGRPATTVTAYEPGKLPKRFEAALSPDGKAEVIDTAWLEAIVECANMKRAAVIAGVLNDAIGWTQWRVDGDSA